MNGAGQKSKLTHYPLTAGLAVRAAPWLPLATLGGVTGADGRASGWLPLPVMDHERPDVLGLDGGLPD